jgi:peroxiredoxin
MLSSNKNPKPAFDYNELIAELEIPFKKRQSVKPLKTGNYVYDFILEKENINRQLAFKNGETHSSVVLRKLAGKPLVISFYSSQWQEYRLSHLKQLNRLQNEIKALGANILIITPDAMDQALTEIIWNHSLYLNFYYDQDNLIAKKFKVYSDQDPAWNRYPGIEVNIPLLATYILDTANQIIFDHVDQTLEEGVASDELFEVLHNGPVYELKSKSA